MYICRQLNMKNIFKRIIFFNTRIQSCNFLKLRVKYFCFKSTPFLFADCSQIRKIKCTPVNASTEFQSKPAPLCRLHSLDLDASCSE